MKYLALLFLLIIKACSESSPESNFNFNEDKLVRTWRLSEVMNHTVSSSNEDKLLADAYNSQAVEQGMLFCFFNDNTCAEIYLNEYIKGTWKLSGDEKEIYYYTDEHSDTIAIQNYEAIGDRNYLTVNYINRSDFKFLEIQQPLTEAKMDPFHPSNNLWRIKPDTLESLLQIKERLANFVQHYAYLLNASETRSENIVSFEFSKGIIQIYNGGIGAVRQPDIPAEWGNYFYNTDQALAAYKLLIEYIQKGEYKGATTGSWVKDDYNLLISIYKNIKNDISNSAL